ncbi:MAG: amidase [Chloroflexi bacterium]|nr:amidase [Chloroflexota bacterium]
MTPQDLCFMPAVDMAAAIRAKKLSPVDIVDALYARIHALNPKLNAYCTLTEESARREAREAEAAVMRGDKLGLLHGVPVSVKDLVITKGVRTMRGSAIYEHDVPTEDAPSVAKLKAAGAIMLGKTTTPEFGWKGMTDSPVTGMSRNPWNLARTPGGSSGGAAASVAAGMGPLAIGTDGGGSIRIPAAFCGIFGLKPSFGRIAAYPPSAVAILSHVGPMAWSVRDAALMLDAMAGPDERDLGSLPADNTDYLAACEGGIKGLRVAWSANLGYATVDPAAARAAEAAARVFAEQLGCRLEAADPGFGDPQEFFGTIWVGGLGNYLRSYLPQWAERMDPGLVEMVRQVEGLTAADYAGALAKRAAHWNTVRQFFEKYDLLLTPSMPIPAFAVDAPPAPPPAKDGQAVSWSGWTPFTFPFNLTGQPAATVPCGFAPDGLPLGLQIVGPRFGDALVLRAAAAFEAAMPWGAKRPPA